MADSSFTDLTPEQVANLEQFAEVTPTPEQIELDAREQQELITRGVIFTELMKSDRFVNFVKCNYDFAQMIDDETKTITLQVVEVPGEEVMKRLTELQQILGPEAVAGRPQIQVASPDDLRALEDQARKAGVLK